MLITITGKHIEITEAIRERAEEKVSKLPKFYNNLNQIEVVIDGSEGINPKVEIIARAEHSKVFVGTDTGDDLYSSIDLAVHKIESQLRKAKSRERDNKYSGGAEPE